MSRTAEIQEVADTVSKGGFAEVCFCPAKSGWACIKQVQDCQRSRSR